MVAPNSKHEAPVDGFDVHGAPGYSVQPTLSTAPNQPLQLVPYGSRSFGPANVTGLGDSGIDGLGVSGDGLYSSSSNFGRGDSRVGSTSCSTPKPSKKKSSCYNRRRSDVKKERLIWTPELHQCFLESYNRLPKEQRVPKKITADMKKKIGNLVSRENVASHLQKHRLNINGKENKKRNSAKPASSKSVPPKEEINFPKFYNDTSNSTYHNTPQILHQSHFISTNPNSGQLPLQSPAISTSPKPQSHSRSTIPNSQLPLNYERMVNQLLSPFEQTHLSNPNTLHAQSSLDVGRNNDLSIDGEATIYSNKVNVLERQENYPFGVIGHSSNVANNSNFPVMANHFLPILTNNQVSNFYGYGNAFHPTMGNSNFGGLSGNDYSLGALPNFIDYNMNLNWDQNVQADGLNNLNWGHNVQVDGPNNMNMNLQFNYPFNFNVANDLQVNDFEQGFQSKLYPPGDNRVDNK